MTYDQCDRGVAGFLAHHGVDVTGVVNGHKADAMRDGAFVRTV
jgi:hypothetical protein